MCEAKPGLRCNSHASSNFMVASMKLHEAIAEAQENPDPRNDLAAKQEKFEKAKKDYWCSDEGMNALRDEGYIDEFIAAQNMRENRKHGVIRINQASAAYKESKTNQQEEALADKQVDNMLNTKDSAQIESFKELLEQSKDYQASTDRALRQQYTDILDSGDTSHNDLAKYIAMSSAKLDRIKRNIKKIENAQSNKFAGQIFNGRHSMVDHLRAEGQNVANNGHRVTVELDRGRTMTGVLKHEDLDDTYYVEADSGRMQPIYSNAYNNLTAHEVRGFRYLF